MKNIHKKYIKCKKRDEHQLQQIFELNSYLKQMSAENCALQNQLILNNDRIQYLEQWMQSMMHWSQSICIAVNNQRPITSNSNTTNNSQEITTATTNVLSVPQMPNNFYSTPSAQRMVSGLSSLTTVGSSSSSTASTETVSSSNSSNSSLVSCSPSPYDTKVSMDDNDEVGEKDQYQELAFQPNAVQARRHTYHISRDRVISGSMSSNLYRKLEKNMLKDMGRTIVPGMNELSVINDKQQKSFFDENADVRRDSLKLPKIFVLNSSESMFAFLCFIMFLLFFFI